MDNRMCVRAYAVTTVSVLVLLVAAAGAEPTLQWDDLLDGGGDYTDVGTVALIDPEGHLVVGGESTDTVGGSDILIRKLRKADGDEIWSLRWASADGNDMAVTAMCWDPFDDVLVGGYIRGCVG
jgi:hypothetical protein